MSKHFGTPIHLVLVVDQGSTEVALPKAPASNSPSGQSESIEVDEIDFDDVRMATATDVDEASAAEARLLEAFPGAAEVAE